MNTHADKTNENKSQSVSNGESQMQSAGESTFQFVDNRPEAIAQRKLREMADNRPRALQMKKLREMANNSPQAKQTAQLQSMADNHSTQQQQPPEVRGQAIQKKAEAANAVAEVPTSEAVGKNNTSLPNTLKTGIEYLSRNSMDEVSKNYDSAQHSVSNGHLMNHVIQRKIIVGTGTAKKTWDNKNSAIEESWKLIEQAKRLYTDWLGDDLIHEYKTDQALFDALNHAALTEYHFGLAKAKAKHRLGHRMDFIIKEGAGTVAEYDWNNKKGMNESGEEVPRKLPAHIKTTDHERLAGGFAKGMHVVDKDLTSDAIRESRIRQSAAKFKESNGESEVPKFNTEFEKLTWYRKAKSSKQDHKGIKTKNKPDTDVHPGVDFSKAALADQLVQGKKIHMHLTGMKTQKGKGSIMTGKDFMEVLEKSGTYKEAGGMKKHVTFRELRMIYRYWSDRKLIMPDLQGEEREFAFEGNVIFYYEGVTIPPPWTWDPQKTGESILRTPIADAGGQEGASVPGHPTQSMAPVNYEITNEQALKLGIPMKAESRLEMIKEALKLSMVTEKDIRELIRINANKEDLGELVENEDIQAMVELLS